MLLENHPEYQRNLYAWGYVRDAINGESAVKRLNTRYLPMPSAMVSYSQQQVVVDAGSQQMLNSQDDGLSNMELPFYHPNPAYMAYLQRARYPLLVAHTVRAFTGIAMRKEPTIELPEDMEYLRDLLVDVYRRGISGALGYGRLWLVVDINDDGEFHIQTYKALSGVDWEEDEYVVFQEQVRKGKKNSTGRKLVKLCMLPIGADGRPILDEESSWEENGRTYVVLSDPEGTGDFSKAEAVIPQYMGATLDSLPVVCCGSIDLDWQVDPIPVEGILGCAAQIYMKNADLSQAEYMSCNPLLIFFGIDKEETPRVIGSTMAIGLPSKEECDAKYIEPAGSALEHMREVIQDLHGEAAEYGAQLLGASKSQVESGDALRLRQNASGASLLSVMQLVAQAVDECLDIIAKWSGKNRDLFKFSYDSDLAEVSLSPQELTALTQCWIGGGISYDTYFNRLQQAGIIEEGRTPEEERALIEQEAPDLLPPSTPTQEDKANADQPVDDDTAV